VHVVDEPPDVDADLGDLARLDVPLDLQAAPHDDVHAVEVRGGERDRRADREHVVVPARGDQVVARP